ncbi:FAD-dependent oxidoreductase [Myxococcota bacterium]|nr:FAD-dependent oxidoreductase [Myxococcota bacterium]
MVDVSSSNPAIVVGAGLAGLTAAAYLARAGVPTLVLERASVAGGRARTEERDGFSLNLGPHALYRRGPGRAVLDELAIAPRGRPARVDGAYALVGGRAHTLPTGLLSLLTTDLLPLAEKLEAARFLATLEHAADRAPRDRSFAAWLDERGFGPSLARFVGALVRLATYAGDLDGISAKAALAQVARATHGGVEYLDGGWRQLVDALSARVVAYGARMRFGANVVRVEHSPDGVDAVLLADGERLDARAVVVATTPTHAATILSQGTGRLIEETYAHRSVSRAACLDLCLTQLPVPHATFALGVDAPVYLSVHSAAAKLAPDGHALVSLMRYLGPTEVADASRDRAELEAVADVVQPGWRALARHVRFLPELVVTHALPRPVRDGREPRLDGAVPGAPGIFVAGDWVGTDELLADAALTSGRRAALSIVGAFAEHEVALQGRGARAA